MVGTRSDSVFQLILHSVKYMWLINLFCFFFTISFKRKRFNLTYSNVWLIRLFSVNLAGFRKSKNVSIPASKGNIHRKRMEIGMDLNGLVATISGAAHINSNAN